MGVFGVSGMIYVATMSIKGGYERGFPEFWRGIFGLGCLGVAVFIFLYLFSLAYVEHGFEYMKME